MKIFLLQCGTHIWEGLLKRGREKGGRSVELWVKFVKKIETVDVRDVENVGEIRAFIEFGGIKGNFGKKKREKFFFLQMGEK